MGLDEEEEAVVRDTGKKSKHSKKNKMNDLEESSLRPSKEGEEKKRKKKHVVSGDIKLDEDGNGMGCEEVDGNVQKEKDQKKKKKKRKLEFSEDVSNCKDAATIVEENVIESSENNKKKKKKKEKQDVCEVVQNEKDKIHKKKRKLDHDEDEDENEDEDALNEEAQMEGQNGQKSSEKEDIANINNGGEGSKEKKSKKEKKKKTQDGKDSGKMREENVKDNDGAVEKKRKKENKKDENDSENPKAKEKKPKKVSFSSNVEVFPAEEELVRGKRFSKEEDEKVKEAVHNYIETHNLGEEGLNKVLNCSSHRELKNCWKEIGAAIPYRPFRAIYYRAHILFERGETRKWTQEEYEFIKKAQEKHGNNWKLIADELGKHRFHVKDTWRRIKLPNMKKGHWSQEEYQTLFDLVNTDLQMKASAEKKSKHGMLRDNICWGAISDKLSTRSNQTCCIKWYTQLTSSMVEEGIWADVDDYRLLDALFNLDACCVEDVDWDRLLEHRPGEVCRKRWDQMVLHIGQHGLKSFGEQVDILAKRYCPDLVEVREEWDGKPVVD